MKLFISLTITIAYQRSLNRFPSDDKAYKATKITELPGNKVPLKRNKG